MYVAPSSIGFSKFFSFGFGSAVNGQKFSISSLCPDDKRLYDSVVRYLLKAFEPRAIQPQLTKNTADDLKLALVFRQSKSWNNVEKMLQVAKNELKEKYQVAPSHKSVQAWYKLTRPWAKRWVKLIRSMRTDDEKIKTCARDLINAKEQLSKAKLKDRAALLKEISALKKEIVILRGGIKKDLKELWLSTIKDATIANDSICKRVIDYIKENKDYLCLFMDRAEVSIDDDGKISVLLCRQQTVSSQCDIPLESKDATKAIFLIEEKERTETPMNYHDVEPGVIITPTKVVLKHSHVEHIPSLLTDSLLFDCEFLDDSPHKFPSDTAKKLKMIVELALGTVNHKLGIVKK